MKAAFLATSFAAVMISSVAPREPLATAPRNLGPDSTAPPN